MSFRFLMPSSSRSFARRILNLKVNPCNRIPAIRTFSLTPPVMSTVEQAQDKPAEGLVVHHLNNSRSQRILWLLEELEVPYTLKKYKRHANQTAPKELLAINPLGKSPVITDGDVTLAESGAIVEYIIAKFGNGRADPPNAGKVDNLYYTHYAEGSLMPILITQLIFSMVTVQSPFFVRPIARLISDGVNRTYLQPEVNKHLTLIESHFKKMGDKKFIAGGENPTAADYMMMFPLEGIMLKSPGSLCPEAEEYVRRNQARPAYKRGLERGGGEYVYSTKL